MKRKPVLLLLAALLTASLAWGQAPAVPDAPDVLPQPQKKESTHQRNPDNAPVNFGIKGGFTASLFLVSDLSINGQRIEQVQNNYQIGYFASLFMRINFDRHFIQPEVSYNINRCNITFTKPLAADAPEGTVPEPAGITSTIHSIDVPVIYATTSSRKAPTAWPSSADPSCATCGHTRARPPSTTSTWTTSAKTSTPSTST